MRLGTVTLSATLSAALLSGCSFIGGQPSSYDAPHAKHRGGHYGQQFAGNRCQIANPRQAIPRGCRPEQVTLGTSGQFGAQGGFPQQPQFGQAQFTNGAYGNAAGQTPAVAHNTVGPKKKKPKLRGSLSLGVERSVGGELIDYGIRNDLNPAKGYNPQDFNESVVTGTPADGLVSTVFYTANAQILGPASHALITRPEQYERVTQPSISFDDVWSSPASVKAGLEYIINDNTTVFANGGYSYAEGNQGTVSTVQATLYRQQIDQPYAPAVDSAGEEIPNVFVESGIPQSNITFDSNRQIASFAYDFSDLERYDLEVGARRYFNPIVKTQGYRTVTPFVGASVGVSHVNAVDFTSSQRQVSYADAFETGTTVGNEYDIAQPGVAATRLYDSQWLPQGQLNVGAEWQLTPGFALAAETGVRIQGGRDYSDFTDATGNFVEGRNGDTNVSVPVTLRGSINF